MQVAVTTCIFSPNFFHHKCSVKTTVRFEVAYIIKGL